jgi:hypothetical protein
MQMTNLANDPKYQMTYLNPQNGRFKKRLKMTDLNPTKTK